MWVVCRPVWWLVWYVVMDVGESVVPRVEWLVEDEMASRVQLGCCQ